MFTMDRDAMLDNIGRMGAGVCGYCIGDAVHWLGGRCDCKYGASNYGPNGRPFGEGTGCPELRSLYLVLATMTDAEWEDLCTRMGGVNTRVIAEALREKFEGGESVGP